MAAEHHAHPIDFILPQTVPYICDPDPDPDPGPDFDFDYSNFDNSTEVKADLFCV